MPSPIRIQITSFDAPRFFAAAKKARIFETHSGGGEVEVRPKGVSAQAIISEVSKYPELKNSIKTGRRPAFIIPDEDAFFFLCLALVDTEMLQYEKLREIDYRNKRIAILKEMRRQSPFTSNTFKSLESEAIRASESIQETLSRLANTTEAETVAPEKSVEEILAEVKARREAKKPRRTTGLLD